MNFKELNLSPYINKAIEEMGFEKATPIQSKTIPLILEGKDIIGQSQTGTGKTAAFTIPILEKIDTEVKSPQVLILCPTRELAVQVCNEIRKISKYISGLKVFPVYGGDPIVNQIRALKKGVQIVVGTPGRVMDHIKRKTLKFDTLNTVILDEADEMLKMGFREDIETILEGIKNERQTILFSATMPKSILEITHKYQKNPLLVKVVHKELTTENVRQRYYLVKDKYKVEALSRLIDVYHPKLSLVFCNTKLKVDEVTDELLSRGYLCDKIHGDINQTVRLSVLNKFNKGQINILVATDVAARGLDINDVEAVFNFEVPEKAEYYVHRIGRTGRAGRSGRSFTLVGEKEFKRINDIMAYIKKDIKVKPVPSLANVNDAKIRKYTDNLKKIVDNSPLEMYLSIIDNLENEGYSAREVAAALLTTSLQLKEGSDIDLSHKKDKVNQINQRRDRKRKSEKGMSRLFVNIGKLDKIKPRDIVGAIAGESKIPGNSIGAVDIYDKFSFVDIPKNYVDKVLTSMKSARIKGRKINVEVANRK